MGMTKRYMALSNFYAGYILLLPDMSDVSDIQVFFVSLLTPMTLSFIVERHNLSLI